MSSVALAQSKADHDALVAAAQAKVSAAQTALQQAVEAHDSAVALGQSLDTQLQQAQQNLYAAQSAYDQSLIPDSSWVRPTKQITVSEQVPYTIQVPVTETVTSTQTVPRQVTTIVASGLIAKSYNMLGYNNRPPLPTEDRLVATQTVDNINFQWGGGQILNSGLYEDVIVNFTGNIYIPTTGTYTFYAPGDDGVQVLIDGNRIINDWYDKGGGGSTVQTNLTEGIHTFTLWFYENGGGANVWLYWATPNTSLVIVPPSAFGQQIETTTVYDEVTVVTEITTYVDQTAYRTETHTETVPDESAVQPKIKDASLLPAILSAQTVVDNTISAQSQNTAIIELTLSNVTTKTQELNVAQQELEAIPPYVEPTPTPTKTSQPTPEPTKIVPSPIPTPEPSQAPEEPTVIVKESVAVISTLTTIDPQSLTTSDIAKLTEATNAVFDNSSQGSAEYNQALQALAVIAQADDPVLPTELAAIPGAAAVLQTFNNLGNVGADISPKVREQAKKTVIASVIAAGAAVQAVAATTSVSSSGGGTSSRRTK